MTSSLYKLDKTYFSSQFGNYQYFQSWRIPFTVSGSIPNNQLNRYQTSFGFSRDNALGRVFLQRADGSIKVPLDAGRRLSTLLPDYTVYQYTSTETVETDVHYQDSGEVLVLNLLILNQTGSTINLVTQQLEFIVDLYDGSIQIA